MNYYLAPLEGITTYIYRNAYHSMFQPMDKYFSPFLVPRMKKSFNHREIQDILPEHNQNLFLVPQLLTNQAKDFVKGAKRLMEYGYQEVNLNLGCPSGTVVARQKGAGFLSKPLELERFLDEIFSSLSIRISIKTRIGMEDPEEFGILHEIFRRFPLEELIIHPRVREDFYTNKPDLPVFRQAFSERRHPICYNGDIFCEQDLEQLVQQVPELEMVMMGRGIIRKPWLREELLCFEPMVEDSQKYQGRLRQFHDKIYQDYQSIMSGEKNVLYKMKELWSYMILLFSDYEPYAKKIRKAETLQKYEIAVNALFREQRLVEGKEEEEP